MGGYIEKPSVKWNMNPTEWKQWGKNLLMFISPVIGVYLGCVAGNVDVPGHIISLADFVPTPITLGAIEVYLLNALIDFFKKLSAGQ